MEDAIWNLAVFGQWLLFFVAWFSAEWTVFQGREWTSKGDTGIKAHVMSDRSDPCKFFNSFLDLMVGEYVVLRVLLLDSCPHIFISLL